VAARDAPAELQRLFFRLTWRLVVVSLTAIPAIMLLAPIGVAVIFGEKWRDAGVYLQLLAPMMMAQFVVSPLSQTVFIINRQDIQLAWDVVRFITVVAVFSLAASFDWTPKTAIGMYGICMFILYLALFLLYRRALISYTSKRAQ
jgi:O-antigen/teichoic acid export membrane protein